MRIALIAAMLTLPMGFAAQAFEHRAPVAIPLYACGKGITRIATVEANPGQCCEGQLSCTQFLATRSILKPERDPRT